MSNKWNICPSSEPYLKRCIAAARPQTEANKWIEKFKRKGEIIDIIPENSQENAINNVSLVCDSDPRVNEDAKDEILSPKVDEEFFQTINQDTVSKFDVLVEECIKRPRLLHVCAERLSQSAIEKLCNHLFTKTDVNHEFLQLFYEIFIPALLKRDHSWLSLDVLVKADNNNPLMFKKTLNLIFKCLEINNQILHDFFQSLSEDKKLIFMQNITENDLSTQEFEHNMLTIYTAYKNCKTTPQVQSYVEKLIVENSESFFSDKKFGKLLLAFLQAQKNLGNIRNLVKLEKVVESHRTAFKKPCMNILRDIEDMFS